MKTAETVTNMTRVLRLYIDIPPERQNQFPSWRYCGVLNDERASIASSEPCNKRSQNDARSSVRNGPFHRQAGRAISRTLGRIA
jgi:hypothetical protein